MRTVSPPHRIAKHISLRVLTPCALPEGDDDSATMAWLACCFGVALGQQDLVETAALHGDALLTLR